MRNIARRYGVVKFCCAVLFSSGMLRSACAGDIAVTNLESATHEIALSLTAPGTTTLKNGVLSLNRPAGTLARSVPPNVSWELLIWKRQSASDPWTFSRAFTVGEIEETQGRMTLMIRPSTNEVLQAYSAGNDPDELEPLPPIPDWQNTPAPPVPDCCPPMTCCPPVSSQLQWSAPHHAAHRNCYPPNRSIYRKSEYRRMQRGR